LAIFVATLAVLGSAGWWVVVDERAQTECGFTPPDLPERLRRASGFHADWEWWPPGHVCVYTDREGRVIGRRRL
jgi:hypothetical protein